MQLSTREALQILSKLKVEVVECSHHYRGFVTLDNGQRLFPVHCSRGNKDLPSNIPHRFRKSLKLTVSEFHNLRSCTMDREAYLALLKENGVIEL